MAAFTYYLHFLNIRINLFPEFMGLISYAEPLYTSKFNKMG